jgi:hypothetical protein
MVADLAALRTKAGAASTELYEIVAALAIGTDPEPYRVAGATWWLAELAADAVSVDRVHAVIRDGPIAHP